MRAADAYYNLLVEGFRRGQLSLSLPAPEGLKQLADPYDPVANAAFRKPMFVEGRLCDMTYFNGKLYLYFSPVPALLLFWPFHAVTGEYLRHHAAVAIFCSIGFLVASGLIFSVWRRYFSGVHRGAVAAGVLVLGLANGVPVMMARPDLWEVPISCAYALMMVALAAIWRGLHTPDRRVRWAVAASVACALAIAARPSALFGALILIIPLLDAWRGDGADGKGRLGAVGAAVVIPLLLVGLALVIYNVQRFGQPLEFGQRYQLADDRQDSLQHFRLSFLWFNFRLYFLSLAGWESEFPFFSDVVVPPLPPGHGVVDRPYGMLTNTPVILLAFAAPLLWRGAVPRPRALRAFAIAVGLVFATSAVVLCLFYGTCTRYLVDFGPALSVLACLGLFLVLDWVRTRRVRLGVYAVVLGLLGPSVAFGVLKSFQGQYELMVLRGRALVATGRLQEGAALYEQIVAARPAWSGAQFELAQAYERLQRLPEAIARCERALRLAPDEGPFHATLARLYLRTGRSAEAVEQFQIALRQSPQLADVHNGLGVARMMRRELAEAERAFTAALRLAPENPNYHFNLALTLQALNRPAEAVPHLEESLRLRPDYPEAREKLEAARREAKVNR